MADKDTFEVLLLLARPAAGKSEIIDYLKHTEVEKRRQRFHIGEFEEIDDFPMLWAWFEEDTLLEAMGKPRLHTTSAGYFKEKYLWDVLIRRIALEYQKKTREPDYRNRFSTIIEFSRGAEHGGYAEAFQHLSDEILQNAAILYVNVSFAESMRKNQARFNPDRPDSILEHGLSNSKMERLYRDVDWEAVSADDPAYIAIKGYRVPYVIFENEDDVTTDRGEALGNRLEETLTRLWALYKTRANLPQSQRAQQTGLLQSRLTEN